MAKNGTPLTANWKDSPHLSALRWRCSVRRPMRCVTLSRSVPSLLTRLIATIYSGCLPMPFGHHNSGFGMFKAMFPKPSLKVILPLTTVFCPSETVTDAPAEVTGSLTVNTVLISRVTLPSLKCFCPIFTSANFIRLPATILTGRQMPQVKRQGPQSQP